MDIGEVSEIPTTRKKLPSMQELGAFELDSPGSAATTPSNAPHVAAPPRASAAGQLKSFASSADDRRPLIKAALPAVEAEKPPAAEPRAEASRPMLSSEQIRNALAKADPGTRKKLLRLIAGGRTVQQLNGTAQKSGAKPQQLVMNLQRTDGSASRPDAAPKRAEKAPVESATQSRSAKAPSRGQNFKPVADSGETLLQIDANTDLLDALPPQLSAEQRKAALQAQLTAARNKEPARSENPAHKVLFPAYDPTQHGDDVHRPARRGDGPVEGHFPAPRQPFKASYQHADGRPMNEEETEVEQVLQEQRCEQTLQVLARDGVNGLLLSPRDLDAAVENGMLDEPTADLLWKTWSALRPVIHVIDDQPAADPAGESPEATTAGEVDSDSAANDANAEAVAEVSPKQDSAALVAALPAPAIAAPAPIPAKPPTSAIIQASSPEITAQPSTPAPADTQKAPAIAAALPAPPLSSRKQRAARLLCYLLRGVIAVSVLHSGARLTTWAWQHWGHWFIQ